LALARATGFFAVVCFFVVFMAVAVGVAFGAAFTFGATFAADVGVAAAEGAAAVGEVELCLSRLDAAGVLAATSPRRPSSAIGACSTSLWASWAPR
jgi:hypothetical protein